MMAAGVALLLVITPWAFSGQITSSVREFGLIGVTFVLATWQLALSVLILGGAAIGAEIVTHRREQANSNVGAEAEQCPRRRLSGTDAIVTAG